MLVLHIILFTICVVAQVMAQDYAMPPADADLHIYALPVGQGDATVIQCPSGTGDLTIVDFGSSTRTQPSEGLTYMTDTQINTFIGFNTVKYVYLTHGDRDHYNLIPKLNIPANAVNKVVIACEEGQYGTLTAWLQQVDTYGNLLKFPDSSAGGCTTTCGSRIQICTGGVYVNVMGANLDIYDETNVCTNTDSLVIRLEYGNFQLLLPGDAEDYSGFTYNSTGYITSNVGDWYGKPGLLRTLIEAWASNGGIQADFYRLAHHGTYPNGNKEFFLDEIGVCYAFSSSKLPGTPGTFNHPRCDLYDLLVDNITTIATVSGSMQQIEYSCGLNGERYNENNNTKGIYTTAVCNTTQNFTNYIIKIDTDGATNNWIGPVELAPSTETCT